MARRASPARSMIVVVVVAYIAETADLRLRRFQSQTSSLCGNQSLAPSSCVRRATSPLALPGRGGQQSHLRLEGRREVGAANMFGTLSRKIPWVLGPPLISRLKGGHSDGPHSWV